MRTIFIGDVHGCLDELRTLFQTVDPMADDRFVFVGDLVDKGPNSLGVLAFVQNLMRLYPGSVVVAGNHEEKALRFAKAGKLDKLVDGHADREWARGATDADWAFIEKMPLTWYDPIFNIRVVHGGIFPSLLNHHPDVWAEVEKRGAAWHKGGGKLMDRARRVLRVRYVGGSHRPVGVKGETPPGEMLELGKNGFGDPFWAETYEGPLVIYGHSPWLNGEVRRDPYAIGIDTACVFGSKLTALIVDRNGEHETVQVGASQRYAQPLEDD